MKIFQHYTRILRLINNDLRKFSTVSQKKQSKQNILSQKRQISSEDKILFKKAPPKPTEHKQIKYHPKPLITEKLHKLDFQTLTHSLSREKLEKDPTLQQDIEKLINPNKILTLTENFDFPWNFQSTEQRREQYMKAIVSHEKYLQNVQMVALYKDFISAIQTFDNEQIESLCENKFAKKLKKTLNNLQKSGLQIDIINMKDAKNLNVDLYNIRNYFTIGVFTNRLKNIFYNDYKQYTELYQEDVQVNCIVKYKQEKTDRAIWICQFDLQVESPIGLRLKNMEKQDEVKEDIIFSQQKQTNWQYFTVECKIIESQFSNLKQFYANQEQNALDLGNVKNFIDKIDFKIIDFNGFMNGNNFIISLQEQQLN